MITTLDFIRHGEPEGGSLYRGAAIDDPLSQKGWKQMWQATGNNNHWDRIISSPLSRCREFALALADRHGLPVATEKDFREVGFGDWEGHSSAEIRETRPREYADFYADPVNNRPTGAEDLHHFGQRVGTAMDKAASAHPGKRILIVAHAGVIRAALGHIMQAPAAAWYRARVCNAGITRFQYGPLGKQLIFHNRPDLHP